MNGNELQRMGYQSGKSLGLALKAFKAARANDIPHSTIREALGNVLNAPDSYVDDPLYGDVAHELLQERLPSQAYALSTSAPYQVWGAAQIDPNALDQMKRAVQLPVAVRGALMPDAHQGYGLPIGGVLATENSVIPYAVGVDIACRMRMTIFDISPILLDQKREKFRRALEQNTRFGAGNEWKDRPEHPVMDDPAWQESELLRRHKGIAWRQLGSSGSGNHFVEFGALAVQEAIALPSGTTIPPGEYLALLSHSGSRRFGMEIANHYTAVAMRQRATLPKEFIQLAWLDLNEYEGNGYWSAMNLAGRYASANHAVIHERVGDAVGLPILGTIENHHNFAWKAQLDGKEVIVHRKGATPAGAGVLGVIPGSMSAPGFVVRGRGNPDSLASASHGAGRRMSRTEAKKRFDWDTIKRKLKADGVEVMSAGLDESPGAYKDIRQVMADQADLVDILAEFKPRLVKMDGSNSPSED